MMRAKFIVESVKLSFYAEIVEMRAVSSGSAEDNSFSEATPSATLTMTISNPDLKGKIKPGMKFYSDFTVAE